jgi:hypothetical protein
MMLTIPEGYTLPEDIAVGDTFEELVSFRYDEGGLTPVSIAGVEIADETAPVEEAEAAMDEESLGMMDIGQSIMGGV